MSGNCDWRGKHFAFYQNKECEYFPCHKGVEQAAFNCLFCYCPLYVMGKSCGGTPTFLPNGIKDCSGCVLPHIADNYGYVTDCFQRICTYVTD